MTRRTNATLAGVAYLLYIVSELAGAKLIGFETRSNEPAARIAAAVQFLPQLRLGVLLTILGGLCALVLAVTLYGITREQDEELALFGAICRTGEGLFGLLPLGALGLIWLATANPSVDAATANTILTAFSAISRWKYAVGATLFAIGSTSFSYLLLRGRIVPAVLAWIGLVASLLLVVGLPLQLVGWLSGSVAGVLWVPMILFEVPLGLWLIFRGAAPPLRTRAG